MALYCCRVCTGVGVLSGHELWCLLLCVYLYVYVPFSCVVCFVSCLYSVGSAKMNLLDSNPLSVYGTVGDRSGDNIGLVWWGMCMSKQCRCEVYVPLIHCATTSHVLGHHCLVSLLYMASLYSTLFNSQNFLFTCLLSFFYRIHMHCMK